MLPTKRSFMVIGVGLVVCVIVFGSAFLVQANYNGRVLPGVSFANINLGGLDRLATTEVIRQAVDKMLDAGLTVSVNDTSQNVALRSESIETTADMMAVDVNKAVDAVLAVGHEAGPIGWLKALVVAIVRDTPVNPQVVSVNSALAEAEIIAAFPEAITEGVPTDYKISTKNDEVSVTVTPGEAGTGLDITTALNALLADSWDLSLKPLTVAVKSTDPAVSESQAASLVDQAKEAIKHAPYTLQYIAEMGRVNETWSITQAELMGWLVPSIDEAGAPKLNLDASLMTDFLAEVHDKVDVAAQDARFAMEGNKVTEFAGSHNGITVNDEQTIAAIVDYFTNKVQSTIFVVADVTEPTVTTGTVNNLGITEALGVGTSSFKGSPSNRLANIQHGVDKLNGLLIAPGETLSLIEKLRPFTIEDGYFPELVIKGDEIKPEIAGGLCQIGTTTFRAVMNSGLKVVERRNHSLVVNYYNDPSNSNPGTDATIYDPSPDFKFMNDTPNYILFAAEMNRTSSELNFTFWGTSDGRKGSYTPPVVLGWTGAGAAVTKETDTLAPGVEKCQAAHSGATTNFTYNVSYADGTTHTEDFFSSYRSLPKICLVGKADVVAEPVVPETPSEVPITP
jgi:vancomycin resistance protein YoaR